MDCSMPGFPVLHYLLKFAQARVHWISNVRIAQNIWVTTKVSSYYFSNKTWVKERSQKCFLLFTLWKVLCVLFPVTNLKGRGLGSSYIFIVPSPILEEIYLKQASWMTRSGCFYNDTFTLQCQFVHSNFICEIICSYSNKWQKRKRKGSCGELL